MTDDLFEMLPAQTSEEELSMDVNDDSDQRMFRTRIQLPAWQNITDSRIERDMRSVFAGFQLPTKQTIAKGLNTIDALNIYVANSLKDIKAEDSRTAINSIQTAAATSVRKWALGRALNQACASHDYGPNVVQVLAKRNNESVAGLYHIRHVARVLSMKDVYMLGMYDAGWDNIRRLSYIADQNIRQQLIAAYISNIPDWNDRKRRDTARRTLSTAIASLCRSNYAELAGSEPKALAAARDVSQEAPEYYEMRKQLQKLLKVFKKASDKSALQRFVRIASDYFIMQDVQDAETLNSFVTQDASTMLTYIDTLGDILNTYKQQLQSLANATPLSSKEKDK